MALVVTIATVDRTTVVAEDTIKINQLADSHTFTAELTIFDVDGDIAITVGSHLVAKEVTIVDGATTFFGGYIASKDTISAEDGSRHIKLLCQGYAILLQETLIEYEEYISTGDPDISDEDAIDDLFANYLNVIDVVDHVVELDPSISILFNKMNLAEIMTAICQRTGGRWYIDNEKKLHYFSLEENEAGFDLSDTPNDVTSFGYYIKPMRRDNGAAIVNEVMVVGQDDWVDTVNDVDSQNLYGVRGAIVPDSALSTIAELQERGNVVLADNKDPKIKLVVNTPHGGATAGDEIDFKSVILNYDSLNGDDKLIIRELNIYWEQGQPVYEMTLGEAEFSAIARASFIDSKLRDLEINPNIPTASRGFVHDIVFSATDEDTVAWAQGTITMDNGTTYSIDADNTGNMGDVTYIYFSKDDSLTVLYTDETPSDAVGRAKILIAVAKPRAAGLHATYLVYGGEGHNALVDTPNIVDDAVTSPKLAHVLEIVTSLQVPIVIGAVVMNDVYGDVAANYNTLYVHPVYTPTVNQPLRTSRAMLFQLEKRGAFDVTCQWGLRGAQGGVLSTGAGDITGAVGVMSAVHNVGTGTILEAAAYLADTPTASVSHPVTYAYGIKIHAQKVTGVTVGWGIWQTGASDYNYFAGKSGFGANIYNAQITIDQNSPTGGIPVAIFDQADESEEFLKFIGQTTDGNITKCLVKWNDVGDWAGAGFLKIYIQDDDATDPIADGAYYIPFYSLSGL